MTDEEAAGYLLCKLSGYHVNSKGQMTGNGCDECEFKPSMEAFMKHKHEGKVTLTDQTVWYI